MLNYKIYHGYRNRRKINLLGIDKAPIDKKRIESKDQVEEIDADWLIVIFKDNGEMVHHKWVEYRDDAKLIFESYKIAYEKIWNEKESEKDDIKSFALGEISSLKDN